MIATRDIKAGECILSEKPFVIENNTVGVEQAFKQFKVENTEWLNLLYYPKQNNDDCDEFSIFCKQIQSNACEIANKEYLLLYCTQSKLNHSCFPNACHEIQLCSNNDLSSIYDQFNQQQTVYALTNIKKGN